MTDKPITTRQFKKFAMRINYLTKRKCDYEVYAKDLNEAHAIAATRFDDEHTDACIRDSVCEVPNV